MSSWGSSWYKLPLQLKSLRHSGRGWVGVGNNPRGCQDSVRKPGVGRRLGTNGFFSKESMGQVMNAQPWEQSGNCSGPSEDAKWWGEVGWCWRSTNCTHTTIERHNLPPPKKNTPFGRRVILDLFYLYMYLFYYLSRAAPTAYGISTVASICCVTATVTLDLNHILDLCCRLWQRQILNALSKARDPTPFLLDTHQDLNPLSHNGNSWADCF